MQSASHVRFSLPFCTFATYPLSGCSSPLDRSKLEDSHDAHTDVYVSVLACMSLTWWKLPKEVKVGSTSFPVLPSASACLKRDYFTVMTKPVPTCTNCIVPHQWGNLMFWTLGSFSSFGSFCFGSFLLPLTHTHKVKNIRCHTWLCLLSLSPCNQIKF